MITPWRPTEEERKAILYLEALGLIHDLGKLSDDFLQSRALGKAIKYNYKLLVDPRLVFPDYRACTAKGARAEIRKWQELADAPRGAPFKDRKDLTAILQGFSFKGWDGADYKLAQLMALANRPGLAKIDWTTVLGKNMHPGLLVGQVHGIAHFEKEDAPDDQAQPYQRMYRATPFGLEDRIPVGSTDGLTKVLESLPLDQIGHILTDQRQEWLKNMRDGMVQGIADTRRPQNDLTLWDWGYMAASLTKAAAAWFFKTKPASHDFTNRGLLAWRTLRVNLDFLGLYQQSDTIRDLLGIGDALKESFKAVQTLLEETYTLANRFYHDETGAYYLFPNFDLTISSGKRFGIVFHRTCSRRFTWRRGLTERNWIPGIVSIIIPRRQSNWSPNPVSVPWKCASNRCDGTTISIPGKRSGPKTARPMQSSARSAAVGRWGIP